MIGAAKAKVGYVLADCVLADSMERRRAPNARRARVSRIERAANLITCTSYVTTQRTL